MVVLDILPYVKGRDAFRVHGENAPHKWRHQASLEVVTCDIHVEDARAGHVKKKKQQEYRWMAITTFE
jgi:hypothetical protein